MQKKSYKAAIIPEKISYVVKKTQWRSIRVRKACSARGHIAVGGDRRTTHGKDKGLQESRSNLDTTLGRPCYKLLADSQCNINAGHFSKPFHFALRLREIQNSKLKRQTGRNWEARRGVRRHLDDV